MILKTTKNRGRGAHDHMVYIGANGTGITSPGEDGHAHIVELIGQEEDGSPIFRLSEVKGHTHELRPVDTRPVPVQRKSKEERAGKVLDLYNDRKNVTSEFHKRMIEDRQSYLSNQWDEQVEAELDNKNRAHHNINEQKAKLDLIIGYLTENRTKRKHSPVEGSDGTVAEVLDRINYHIDNMTNYSIEEELVIEDQCIKGMGVLSLRVDTENNLEGEIVEEKFNPEDVLFGPHEKLDASDCEFAIKRKWLSKDKAKALFPKIADDIDQMMEAMRAGLDADRGPEDDYDVFGKHAKQLGMELFDVSRKNIRLLELLQVVHRRVPVVFNVSDNFYFNAEKLPSEDLDRLLEIPLLSLQRKVFTNVESTKVVGTTFAEHGKTIFSGLPIRPVYCVKDGVDAYGLIHFTKDLQAMANKSRSLYSDIINRAAEYVWLVQRGALQKQQLAKFKKGKVEPGAILEVDQIDQMRKIEGSKVPSEILALEDKYSSMIFDAMGGNSVVAGQANQQGSALLFREFKRQSLLGLRYLQRNLQLTKKAMAKLRLEAIEKLYSPGRVARLVNTESNFHITADDITQALDGVDVLKFDIEIIEDSSASTFKDEQFAIWAELLSTPQFASSIPPQISMSFLLDMANPPGKEKFMAALAQQAQVERDDQLSTNQSQLLASQPDEIKVAEYLKNQGEVQGLPPTQPSI
jgi:hypothetical protein